jgi:hypothetical protein
MGHLKGGLVGSSMSTKCNLAIVRTGFPRTRLYPSRLAVRYSNNSSTYCGQQVRIVSVGSRMQLVGQSMSSTSSASSKVRQAFVFFEGTFQPDFVSRFTLCVARNQDAEKIMFLA